jgi:uncharacterized phage protein (TIGR02220 family)
MEVLQFIKHLRQKGAVHYQIWMPLLIQCNAIDGQEIKLSVTPNVPKTSFYRAIEYGIKVFPKFVSDYTISKQKSTLIINKHDSNIKQIEDVKPIEKVRQKKTTKSTLKDTANLVEKIIIHLNHCAGKNYKTNSKIAINNINARLKDGYEFDDFIKVIEIKSMKWLGTKYEDYLTPNTLFGVKMESYLNESIVIEKTKQEINYEQVSKATELGWNN